jgi:hypothetical protein
MLNERKKARATSHNNKPQKNGLQLHSTTRHPVSTQQLAKKTQSTPEMHSAAHKQARHVHQQQPQHGKLT